MGYEADESFMIRRKPITSWWPDFVMTSDSLVYLGPHEL